MIQKKIITLPNKEIIACGNNWVYFVSEGNLARAQYCNSSRTKIRRNQLDLLKIRGSSIVKITPFNHNFKTQKQKLIK